LCCLDLASEFLKRLTTSCRCCPMFSLVIRG
jgi:hypothetical protein